MESAAFTNPSTWPCNRFLAVDVKYNANSLLNNAKSYYGDADRMPVLECSPESFKKPLETMLEEKYPLKGERAYILQMDNPYLLLNREAFEAAGLSEETAENTTMIMLKQVFAKFSDPKETENHREPPFLTHVYTSKQMREGQLPDTQYSRLIAHSYSPNVAWALHINFAPYQFPWKGSGTTHTSQPIAMIAISPWSSSANRSSRAPITRLLRRSISLPHSRRSYGLTAPAQRLADR